MIRYSILFYGKVNTIPCRQNYCATQGHSNALYIEGAPWLALESQLFRIYKHHFVRISPLKIKFSVHTRQEKQIWLASLAQHKSRPTRRADSEDCPYSQPLHIIPASTQTQKFAIIHSAARKDPKRLPILFNNQNLPSIIINQSLMETR